MTTIKDVKKGMLIFGKMRAEIGIEDPRKNIVLLKYNPKNKIGIVISQKNVKYKDYFGREKMEKKNKEVKTSFNFCLLKILAGEKIKILCNKTTYDEFRQYDKQSFISESGKQEFLDLTGMLEMKKKLKHIYLLS